MEYGSRHTALNIPSARLPSDIVCRLRRARSFTLPDVADLPDAATALRGIGMYIGDGATLQRSMVRMKHGISIGHASIATQLEWCAKAHVPRAIFTHCGSAIVSSDARAVGAIVRNLGREHGIDARLAFDSDRLRLVASSAEKA